MSFSFFKPSKPKTPPELVKAIRESLLALDSKTVAEVKALEKALEEVEKNFLAMRQMLSGDGEVEPNMDQVSQLTLEICKEDIISLVIHKLPSLGWEARKGLVHCWCILLRQMVGPSHCCVEYLENHLELLDFLVVCYDNKEIALHCGIMLRECIKYPNLAKYILESTSFELFFKYVELPNFDVASDAFATFKQDLLTKHPTAVSEFLTSHYEEDSSKNIQISAFHIFKIFVANPNKPWEIILILAKNHEKLLDLLHNLSVGKGTEDEQFEEEKDLIIKEIDRISRLPNFVR
ncbi:PREDICTED: calcium-binding protein 39-like isoform X5 [Nelumbo nucifera]|uniref:Calcium-binding protein 39-like isoform X5 n=1 Tax=Nelumbo nucifera TaxID=4432 RepID=A0A1U8A3L3_NELNU|nr:PREDICTED: calcium-binding protein 39-like isoform X5 [Nelumbo nucifera]